VVLVVKPPIPVQVIILRIGDAVIVVVIIDRVA